MTTAPVITAKAEAAPAAYGHEKKKPAIESGCGIRFPSARALRYLSRVKGRLVKNRDTDSRSPTTALDPVQLARQMYRARRLRGTFLDERLFGEPGWDLMLDLYVAAREDREVAITGFCTAASVPLPTGLRWLQKLEKVGLIVRKPDAKDGRRFPLVLSQEADDRITDYLLRVGERLDAN
jgi:hypothetical protein